MIDGFKLKVTDYTTIQKLFHNPKLDFKSEVSHLTGEVSNIYRARYKGLHFEYIHLPHRQTVFIRGSLPKYYTGLSNYTNIPLSEALEGLGALAAELGLDRHTTAVLSLEWGLNITLPPEISVNRLIQNILVYKGKQPSKHCYERGGMLFLIDLADFSIKIYNKGAQHQGYEHNNVMRYELRIKRKPLLQRLGVYSLADLFDSRCTDRLQGKLLETIRHLLFYDYGIKGAEMPARSKALFLAYSNSAAWVKLMQSNPELYRKKKKSFTKQVAKVSGVDWNKLLQERVSTESKQLLAKDTKQLIPPVLQSL